MLTAKPGGRGSGATTSRAKPIFVMVAGYPHQLRDSTDLSGQRMIHYNGSFRNYRRQIILATA